MISDNALRIQRGSRATSGRVLVTGITLGRHGNCTEEMHQTRKGNGGYLFEKKDNGEEVVSGRRSWSEWNGAT